MKTVGLILTTLFASAFFSVTTIAFMMVEKNQEDVGLILVVAYPWGPDASDIITSAGLTETYPVRAPLGSLTETANPDDLARLRSHGAWLLMDGKRVAELCSPIT